MRQRFKKPSSGQRNPLMGRSVEDWSEDASVCHMPGQNCDTALRQALDDHFRRPADSTRHAMVVYWMTQKRTSNRLHDRSGVYVWAGVSGAVS